MFNKSVISVPSELLKVKTINESVSSTFTLTGNNLWDSLLRECLTKPSFSCIQKNVYTYLDDVLQEKDMNVTNRLRFIKNKVDYRKYSGEHQQYENEISDDEIPETPIEEVTAALYDKSLNFMVTHNMEFKMPEMMFDGAVFKVSPRAIEGNGIIAKLELLPKQELQERIDSSPRIFLKKIKKNIKQKLLLAFVGIILIIKIIKIKVFWLLPMIVGVTTAKKLVLKFLLFLFPALSHIFKLCSYYHSNYHKTNYHHHHHSISHVHNLPSHPHEVPEIILSHPPKGHPSEFIHGSPVPQHISHEYHGPDWEFSGPGLGSEYISDTQRIIHVDNFKPKYDDIKDINAWGLGGTITPSPIHNYNVNPLFNELPRIVNPKPHKSTIVSPIYGPVHRVSAAESQINSNFVKPHIDNIMTKETKRQQFAQQQEMLRIQAEQKLIAKQQQILKDQPFVQDTEILNPKPLDPFYSPILMKLDKIFLQIGVIEEVCKEKLVCSMYKNPSRYSPHSNYVSAELSRDPNELQKPSSTNVAVIRFYRYIQAARDGQDQKDCTQIYAQCLLNMNGKK
ncbi:uncharacterized protein LOC134835318 [Culicoides brevitarsis]|uniref:uncharacterized protein LOC134835318 n=1 Tax=Culicoides brevitarsis TaxID=469753 RepID=UPI00307C7C59